MTTPGEIGGTHPAADLSPVIGNTPSDEMRRRLVRIPASTIVLRDILRLPEGFDVRGVHADYRIDGMTFVVQSPMFEPVPAGEELPVVLAEYHRCDCCGGPIFDRLTGEFGGVRW